MPETPIAEEMAFIGLLTHGQKQAGYFITQTMDFVFLWRSRPHTDCIGVWLYDQCLIKDVRDKADQDINEQRVRNEEKQG